MYGIIVMRTEQVDGGIWERVTQLPLFYLNENTQGIVSCEHAEKVAHEILRDTDTVSHFITAYKI